MKTLPNAFRFVVYNKDTGQTLEFLTNSSNEKASVDWQEWYLDPSTGQPSWGTEQTVSAGSDLANGGVETLTNQTSVTQLGLVGTFHVETDNASAAGDVILGLELSTDGGTTWPSDATNWDPGEDMSFILATITLSGAESHTTDFEV